MRNCVILGRLRKALQASIYWNRYGGADHIFVFSSSDWEIGGWSSGWLKNSVILAVESKPVYDCGDRETGEMKRYCQHCKDCYDSTNPKHIIIPSVVGPEIAHNLLINRRSPF